MLNITSCTHVWRSVRATDHLPLALELWVVLGRWQGRERAHGLVAAVPSLDHEAFEFGEVFGGNRQRYRFAGSHGLAVGRYRVGRVICLGWGSVLGQHVTANFQRSAFGISRGGFQVTECGHRHQEQSQFCVYHHHSGTHKNTLAGFTCWLFFIHTYQRFKWLSIFTLQLHTFMRVPTEQLFK